MRWSASSAPRPFAVFLFQVSILLYTLEL